MNNFNQLTNGEAELLALLSGELSESNAEIAKILRHGYESCNPDTFATDRRTNLQKLQTELGHVQNAINLLVEAGDLDADEILLSSIAKRHTVKKWLHHQD